MRTRDPLGWTPRIVQEISLSAGVPTVNVTTDVDWHENQKLLELALGLDVHAERATSEIQFGHVHRPTHSNTSWDAARFETVAHRWVHVAEPGYGVAVANDAVYGHDMSRSTRRDGGTTTLVRLLLLRAPAYPDPRADAGKHTFRVALRVGARIQEAIDEGYRLNVPLRTITGARGVVPLVTLDNPAIVVEAVKLAEDRSGDVVLRLYEAHGGRARATLAVGFDAAHVVETDLHEHALAHGTAVAGVDGSGVHLAVRPFQIVTLRLRRAEA